MLKHLDLRTTFNFIYSENLTQMFNIILRKGDFLKVGRHSILRPPNSIGTVNILPLWRIVMPELGLLSTEHCAVMSSDAPVSQQLPFL